jgi:hypothetical protein
MQVNASKKLLYSNMICSLDITYLWPAEGNLSGIHATFCYLTIYPFQLRGNGQPGLSWKTMGVNLLSWETAVKPTCVCKDFKHGIQHTK